MQALPHHYTVTASAEEQNNLQLTGDNLPALSCAPPKNFGGPGDQWSPEDLLMASVASCFILSFRAIANASKLSWQQINCQSEGILDKVERGMQFIQVNTQVKLTISNEQDKDKAEKLLHKAEQSCLVLNSMTSQSQLQCEITVVS
ncbi:OsmC family protein [Dasania marina]|uniref:OsmC family protein n=1 Tax=Dasania marina TaxID=471499 RepID=UPI00037991C5|nr:OsmC family protein [Dasania marina]